MYHPNNPRRRSSAAAPLSPSAVPELSILPKPLAADAVPVGQLVSASSKFNPSVLEHRDFDDIGTRWYKDVIFVNSENGKFTSSLGAAHLVHGNPGSGTEVGTIEAEEMRVRMFKDDEAALKKLLQTPEAAQWVKQQLQNGDVGFVTATREVTNASYKRARLVDVGNNNFEVIREVGGEGKDGKRRDSGLDVITGSKKDVVGVVVKKVVPKNGGELGLGEEIGTKFWS